MKISLPDNYSYEDIADVKDGILHIHRLNSFNNLMYDLTYHIKDGSKCYYCSKPLTRSTSTMDHIYPRDLGGVSIPENLCISCAECNSSKSNMFEDEFWVYLSLPEEKKKKFARQCSEKAHLVKKNQCPAIPKEWMTDEQIDKVLVYFFISENVQSKKYKKIEKFYKKYKRFQRPIIVDKDYKLVNGFNTLLYAKNNNINVVPTIVLENVQLD